MAAEDRPVGPRRDQGPRPSVMNQDAPADRAGEVYAIRRSPQEHHREPELLDEAQLVVALKAAARPSATIKRVVVVIFSYQSVPEAGKEGMDELFMQTRAVFVADQVENKKSTKAHRLRASLPACVPFSSATSWLC